MYRYEDYRQILEYWQQGLSKKRIARLTGISRSTVRDCILRHGTVEGLDQAVSQVKVSKLLTQLQSGSSELPATVYKSYSYILGMYLGDGWLARHPRAYKLRIAAYGGYPDIIAFCMQAIQTLLPTNKVNTVRTPGDNREIICYSTLWPDLLPQHGSGKKHDRPIILREWQQTIVDQFPLEFFRAFTTPMVRASATW